MQYVWVLMKDWVIPEEGDKPATYITLRLDTYIKAPFKDIIVSKVLDHSQLQFYKNVRRLYSEEGEVKTSHLQVMCNSMSSFIILVVNKIVFICI